MADSQKTKSNFAIYTGSKPRNARPTTNGFRPSNRPLHKSACLKSTRNVTTQITINQKIDNLSPRPAKKNKKKIQLLEVFLRSLRSLREKCRKEDATSNECTIAERVVRKIFSEALGTERAKKVVQLLNDESNGDLRKAASELLQLLSKAVQAEIAASTSKVDSATASSRTAHNGPENGKAIQMVPTNNADGNIRKSIRINRRFNNNTPSTDERKHSLDHCPKRFCQRNQFGKFSARPQQLPTRSLAEFADILKRQPVVRLQRLNAEEILQATRDCEQRDPIVGRRVRINFSKLKNGFIFKNRAQFAKNPGLQCLEIGEIPLKIPTIQHVESLAPTTASTSKQSATVQSPVTTVSLAARPSVCSNTHFVIPKNTDRNVHYGRHALRQYCLICRTAHVKHVLLHYAAEHPDAESNYLSRLPAHIATHLRQLPAEQVLQSRSFSRDRQKVFEQLCIFCDERLQMNRDKWAKHFCMHMCEPRYECQRCERLMHSQRHRCSPKKKSGGRASKNGMGMVRALDRDLEWYRSQTCWTVYVCRLCNFARFVQAEVWQHLCTQHNFGEMTAEDDAEFVDVFEAIRFFRPKETTVQPSEGDLTSNADDTNAAQPLQKETDNNSASMPMDDGDGDLADTESNVVTGNVCEIVATAATDMEFTADLWIKQESILTTDNGAPTVYEVYESTNEPDASLKNEGNNMDWTE